MSVVGMSNLVAAMVACSGQGQLAVRDHRRLHEALVGLAGDVSASDGLPELHVTPDPEVGRRVQGVTKAIWHLHANGAFEADESAPTAWYLANQERLRDFSKPVTDMAAETVSKVVQRALSFGKALETDLKNSRKLV